MYCKLVLLICVVGFSQKVFSQGINNSSTGATIIEANGVYQKLLVKGQGSYNNNPNAADLQIGFGLGPTGTTGSVSRLALQP